MKVFACELPRATESLRGLVLNAANVLYICSNIVQPGCMYIQGTAKVQDREEDFERALDSHGLREVSPPYSLLRPW